jgi:hypothetical protein
VRVNLKRIDAARLRARARAVRSTDRRVFWMSEVDRARRERLADLMDAAAERAELAAADDDAAADYMEGVRA